MLAEYSLANPLTAVRGNAMMTFTYVADAWGKFMVE